MKEPARYRLLVVEDDRFQQEFYRVALGGAFDVEIAGSLADARKVLLNTHSWDMLLVDGVLPDGHGVSLIQEVREARPDLPTALMTASDSYLDLDGARRLTTVLDKPVDVDVLLALLEPLHVPMAHRPVPAGLEALWIAQRPAILARLDDLSLSLSQLAVGPTPDLQRQIRQEVHDMGGLLGVLGRCEASDNLRVLERKLQSGPVLDGDLADVHRMLELLRSTLQEIVPG